MASAEMQLGIVPILSRKTVRMMLAMVDAYCEQTHDEVVWIPEGSGNGRHVLRLDYEDVRRARHE